MGRSVPVCRLLCCGDRYQCLIRCRDRRPGPGNLVLVPVRLRPWICDDLSGAALQRTLPEERMMNSRSAVSPGVGGWSAAIRIYASLSASLIAISPTSNASAGGVVDVPCPPGAIAVEPGASIQAAVDSAGDGAVFCLKNGTHR